MPRTAVIPLEGSARRTKKRTQHRKASEDRDKKGLTGDGFGRDCQATLREGGEAAVERTGRLLPRATRIDCAARDIGRISRGVYA